MRPIPLVLVPGLLCTPELWQPQLDRLAPLADAHVADVTGAETVEGLAREALAAAPERFALAGLSLGGYVALAMARQAPGRVLGLALLATNARADAPEARPAREAIVRLAEEGRFAEVPGRLIPRLVHPDRQTEPALLAAIERMAHAVGPAACVRQERAIMGRPDARAALGETRVPTLVLCGEDDVITPPEHHREMASLVPGATLRVLPRCGHLSTLERPGPVAGALEGWLAEVRAHAPPGLLATHRRRRR